MTSLTQKRSDYINWDDYFMATALLAAKRSKDPVTQVGACIVNEDKRIVGVGYNGFPRGCSDDIFSWGKGSDLNSKHMYVCHAEVNAILNKSSANLKNCTLYVTKHPCNECTKIIIQSNISEVICMGINEDNISVRASKLMFTAADVKLTEFKPTMKEITLTLSENNSTPSNS